MKPDTVPFVRRLPFPWEERPSAREFVPWERRLFYPDAKNGYIREAAATFDRASRTINQVINTHNGCRLLKHADLVKMQKIMRKTDCTFAEAAIQVIGEPEFIPSFLARLKAAPPVKYLRPDGDEEEFGEGVQETTEVFQPLRKPAVKT